MEQVVESFIIPKSKKTAKKLKKAGFLISFMAYPLILFAIFYVYVNFSSILLAFQSIKLSGEKTWVGFKNFVDFWKGMFSTNNSDLIAVCFKNSLKMYIISLVICMPLYIFFSYLLFKQCLGHKVIRAVSMLPQIISGFVICMLFKNFISGSDAPAITIFEKLHIFVDKDGYGYNLLFTEAFAFGTTLFYSIWLSFGTNLIVYPNAMKEISPEVIESSRLDGISNMFQDLYHIVLPLIFPTLETFLITGLAAIFSNEGPLMGFYFTEAPIYVQNMGYFYSCMIINNSVVSYPTAAAGGLIMTLFVAPATLLLRWVLEKFGPTTEA